VLPEAGSGFDQPGGDLRLAEAFVCADQLEGAAYGVFGFVHCAKEPFGVDPDVFIQFVVGDESVAVLADE